MQGRHDKIDDTLKPGESSEKASSRAIEQVLWKSFLDVTLFRLDYHLTTQMVLLLWVATQSMQQRDTSAKSCLSTTLCEYLQCRCFEADSKCVLQASSTAGTFSTAVSLVSCTTLSLSGCVPSLLGSPSDLCCSASSAPACPLAVSGFPAAVFTVSVASAPTLSFFFASCAAFTCSASVVLSSFRLKRMSSLCLGATLRAALLLSSCTMTVFSGLVRFTLCGGCKQPYHSIDILRMLFQSASSLQVLEPMKEFSKPYYRVCMAN